MEARNYKPLGLDPVNCAFSEMYLKTVTRSMGVYQSDLDAVFYDPKTYKPLLLVDYKSLTSQKYDHNNTQSIERLKVLAQHSTGEIPAAIVYHGIGNIHAVTVNTKVIVQPVNSAAVELFKDTNITTWYHYMEVIHDRVYHHSAYYTARSRLDMQDTFKGLNDLIAVVAVLLLAYSQYKAAA